MTIKVLSKSIREFKKDSILTPIFVAAEVIMEVLIPLFMAKLIDNGIYKNDMGYTVLMGVLLLVASVVSMFFGVIAGRTSSVASAGFAKNLRQDAYYNVQRFSFSNIDKFSSSSIITRLTTDISNVQMAYQMLIRMAVRSPLMLIFAVAASFSISVKLSLVFLAIVPFLGLGLYLIISKTHPLFERVFKTYDKLNGVVGENLSGIRVVKSFVREDHENKKFSEISELIYRDFSHAEKNIAYNMPLMQFCLYTCLLIVAWLGAKDIVASGNNAELGLSTGELVSLISYAMQILMGLMMLSMVFVMIVISRASAERIAELISEESNLHNPEKPVTEIKDGSIDFDGVDFSYSSKNDKKCLDSINLHIKSGETVGIIGGTGSSKSSLVQLIPRLYDSTGGTVKVGGRDVREYDVETLRNQVAMVLQKNVLFSGTINENLRWGNENASDSEIVRVSRLAQADSFVRNFPDKYETHIEQGGTNVSGGQKQRLCIARALLKKPKILILDDSTSAVDTKTDALIRKAFREEIPDTTKIIIAQRISSVQDADKIIVMDDGKITAAGTHEELIASSDIYREVYESQVKGGDDNEANN